MPAGIVAGPALVDFTNAPDPSIRAAIALALVFASRVATAATTATDSADTWLARYTQALDNLGFARSGHALVEQRFAKTGMALHRAIIPFLTMALGGAALGPVILAGLQNLSDAESSAPWIALFDRHSRRLDVHELHFAAVENSAAETHIRYAIARLNVQLSSATILFSKITRAKANFHTAATDMTVSNALLTAIAPDLRARLEADLHAYVRAAFLDAV
ncbi:MAG: hypothetical protein ACKVOB_10120 [Sphingomonas sp.]